MNEDKRYSMLDENAPHYAVVGLVASRWAFLEAAIDETIANLVAADEDAITCITAQLIGPARRMDALMALAQLRRLPESLIKKLKSFQGCLQQLGEDRNRVVHDPLVERTGEISKYTATAKGILRQGFAPADLDEMRKVSAKVDVF